MDFRVRHPGLGHGLYHLLCYLTSLGKLFHFSVFQFTKLSNEANKHFMVVKFTWHTDIAK